MSDDETSTSGVPGGDVMPAGLNAAQKKRWKQKQKAKQEKALAASGGSSESSSGASTPSLSASAGDSDAGSAAQSAGDSTKTAAEIEAEPMPAGLNPAQKKKWKAKQKARLDKAREREAASSPSGAKPKDAAKKKGINKGMAELLRQRQEADEADRRAKEEAKLEAQRQQEEDERIAAEREAAALERRAANKDLNKEKAARKAEAEAQAKRAAALARLGIDPNSVAANAGNAKPKKPIYAKKKNTGKKDAAASPSSGDKTDAPAATDSAGVDTSAAGGDAEPSWASWEEVDADAILAKLEGRADPEPEPEAEKAPEAKPAEKAAEPAQSDDVIDENRKMRSPICVIMGHVDTGKTKLLDKIRRTNVQDQEAGGITQQIGATYFPMDNIQKQLSKLPEKVQSKLDLKMPGLLIIDTPGHESFANLRSRGSGLCDIAILVVDIMHGMEPQTLESLELLKMRKTPFVVALNKVDRLFDWKQHEGAAIQDTLDKQSKDVLIEYDRRTKEAIALFAKEGLNAALYYKNPDFRKYISIVPTSAHSGEGIPDLLMLLCQLTQKMQAERLYLKPRLDCTVLEVKQVDGLGTTIDVILINGELHAGDEILVCGFDGPIRTKIRALLTPGDMKELRVKSTYVRHQTIPAAMGIKISAPGLEKAIAGTELLRIDPGSDIEELEETVMRDLDKMLKAVARVDRGVYVVASTLGSLEALMEFLRTSTIPVSGISLGDVSKKDVVKASAMLENAREYAVILAFDVKVNREAEDEADRMGVRIMTADIIYHLFDQFTAYMEKVKEAKRAEAAGAAVFPCRLKILSQHIINKHDPIIIGVQVEEGSLRLQTPLCVPSQGMIELGRVTSIEFNNETKTEAKVGQQVAIRIDQSGDKQKYSYGRHFGPDDELVSLISRKSIDLLKEQFRDDITKEDVRLLAKLKAVFKIQ